MDPFCRIDETSATASLPCPVELNGSLRARAGQPLSTHDLEQALTLTKTSAGTKLCLFRGHLSRPACSHVKKIAKQAGDKFDPGRTQVQAGFFMA
jgi:hypothetical protein